MYILLYLITKVKMTTQESTIQSISIEKDQPIGQCEVKIESSAEPIEQCEATIELSAQSVDQEAIAESPEELLIRYLALSSAMNTIAENHTDQIQATEESINDKSDSEIELRIAELEREIEKVKLEKELKQEKAKLAKLEKARLTIRDVGLTNIFDISNIKSHSDIKNYPESTFLANDPATPEIKPDEKSISKDSSDQSLDENLVEIILPRGTLITTGIVTGKEIEHSTSEECKGKIISTKIKVTLATHEKDRHYPIWHLKSGKSTPGEVSKYCILLPKGSWIINNGVEMKLQKDAWYYARNFCIPANTMLYLDGNTRFSSPDQLDVVRVD